LNKKNQDFIPHPAKFSDSILALLQELLKRHRYGLVWAAQGPAGKIADALHIGYVGRKEKHYD
jgi:hypothetical protein